MTDKHYTTPELALTIVSHLIDLGDLCVGDRVLDPCVGLGAFSNAVKAHSPSSHVVTIDEDCSVAADIHRDFLQVPITEETIKFQLIVSNPPFSLAQRFVEKSVAMLDPRGTVAFLLLLQFLGSNGRKGFFEQYPPTSVDVLRPRPSFAEDGSTDMREYALFRWCPQDFNCGSTHMGWIDWEKPSRRGAKKATGV